MEKLFHLFTVDLIIVRYADDIIIGFEHETDDRMHGGAPGSGAPPGNTTASTRAKLLRN